MRVEVATAKRKLGRAATAGVEADSSAAAERKGPPKRKKTDSQSNNKASKRQNHGAGPTHKARPRKEQGNPNNEPIADVGRMWQQPDNRHNSHQDLSRTAASSWSRPTPQSEMQTQDMVDAIVANNPATESQSNRFPASSPKGMRRGTSSSWATQVDDRRRCFPQSSPNTPGGSDFRHQPAAFAETVELKSYENSPTSRPNQHPPSSSKAMQEDSGQSRRMPVDGIRRSSLQHPRKAPLGGNRRMSPEYSRLKSPVDGISKSSGQNSQKALESKPQMLPRRPLQHPILGDPPGKTLIV
ncbi:hypothetical protein K402DRAFT_399541 [Aulographum hederae CBS 113979]|uniref:Uncharacterized protein n=1 Tax=Aulographum hederae CBS 113979 TaxID=1176131 RepID=A0A6G1HH83_9PEZI|nr:hypothetical protein K402DRAFT_399541 [Aulographum hederae CBS 113979]